MKVEVENLRRVFGRLTAVDGLSFDFESGGICGFVGPNGSGKTTTMRIIATTDEPDAGDVRFNGVSAVAYPEKVRGLFGYMPDTLPDNRNITVREYLDFFARAAGLRLNDRRRRLDEVEETINLAAMRDKQLHSLSKGMKQRVTLARAVIADPEVLILDEPAAGLDPLARVELRNLLTALRDRGKAILLSSHILSELDDVCDSVVIIEKGRLMRTGKAGEWNAAAGNQTLMLKIRLLSDSGSAEAVLKEMAEVMEFHGGGDRTLLVKLSGGDEAAAVLLAKLVGSGVRVCGFERGEIGLEDFFMRATRGEVQ